MIITDASRQSSELQKKLHIFLLSFFAFLFSRFRPSGRKALSALGEAGYLRVQDSRLMGEPLSKSGIFPTKSRLDAGVDMGIAKNFGPADSPIHHGLRLHSPADAGSRLQQLEPQCLIAI